ncbi:hypothetical protein RB597_007057 [Gaeumannomyces tritici]
MKLVQFASAVALLGAGVNASAWWNYKTVAEYEPTSNSIVKHEGTPVGEEIKYEGLTLYVTKPKGKKADKAVLYITDVFGIQLAQNKLLADSFARAGFVTMAPDLFDGVPAPEDLNKPGFNSTAFLAKYNAGVTDPKLATSIKYLREVLGAKVVGGTGYCYGGRYSFRFAAKGKGLDAAFAAHPSLLEDGEIVAATKPAGIAAAGKPKPPITPITLFLLHRLTATENDSLFSTERRHAAEGLLQQADIPFQVSLYSGTSHGFGVRANVSDPQQKFAKEAAFFQAVRWFNAWM